MWGEGYILPTSCAFERQFEPMGKAEDGEADYYLYRRNLEGRAVKLTPHDYRETVAMFFWSVVRRWFWTVLIYGVSLAAFNGAEPAIYPNDELGVPIVLAAAPAAIFFWKRRKRDWRRSHDRLAGRKKVGADRSPQEAKALRFAVSGWTPIVYCIALVGIPTLVVIQEGPYPQPRHWIWLGPLGAAIVAGLSWWSILKARTIRALDEAWSSNRERRDARTSIR